MIRRAGAASYDRYLRATASISPFDIRWCLALIALPLAWKVLSLDFTALGELCVRPPIFRFYPAWLYDALVANRCSLYVGNNTRIMQVVAAALLIAFVARPSRWLLAPALALVWLLDTGAALFRFNFFTIDTPLALLMLVLFAPARLDLGARGGLEPNAHARTIFTVCLAYVATYYVLAGLAKVMFDWRWPFVVRVGNYYPISYLWHGQIMPEPIDTIARVTSESMRARPWLDSGSSFIVLIEQFVWLLAPFSVIARVHAGIFAAGYHVVVALTTGIMFVTWIPIALAVSLPFSTIARFVRRDVKPPSLPIGQRSNVEWRPLYAAAVAMALAVFPSRGTVVPPFYNYLAFGWRYFEFAEMKPLYRVGFRDPSGRIVTMPLHHAGFLDFMHAGYLDVSARMIIEQRANDATRRVFMESARNLLTVLRPSEANGWLLGRFRAPVHLYSEPGQIEVHRLRKFMILRGVPVPGVADRPAGATWSICGTIDLDQPSTETMFKLHETCRDAG